MDKNCHSGKVVAVAVSNYLYVIEHTTTMGDSIIYPSRGLWPWPNCCGNELATATPM